MASRFIVGLDIGTNSIKVSAAELRGGKIILKAVYKEPSSGLRHGAISDLAEAVPAVSKALEPVKKFGRY